VNTWLLHLLSIHQDSPDFTSVFCWPQTLLFKGHVTLNKVLDVFLSSRTSTVLPVSPYNTGLLHSQAQVAERSWGKSPRPSTSHTVQLNSYSSPPPLLSIPLPYFLPVSQQIVWPLRTTRIPSTSCLKCSE
jgi:hypothetical protein